MPFSLKSTTSALQLFKGFWRYSCMKTSSDWCLVSHGDASSWFKWPPGTSNKPVGHQQKPSLLETLQMFHKRMEEAECEITINRSASEGYLGDRWKRLQNVNRKSMYHVLKLKERNPWMKWGKRALLLADRMAEGRLFSRERRCGEEMCLCDGRPTIYFVLTAQFQFPVAYYQWFDWANSLLHHERSGSTEAGR